ncbi:LysR family transcriptional regulator [Gloeocapsa sp. BRSZ]|uniref:LysR family transcriptional regulator n=1 Tax=Gloeocapsa sp. PCC 7428 TaxID=1173026 RepID=UPI0002A607B1|nr:LysR family transcriptional regulator [Gloeocapsa sp. PCC 7428]AFZ32985.1 transcriptional regulator, LysR family [Gloeocapsa sp. PCC 7428]
MKANYQNQMKLSQLRILVAVAEWENFSEAALQLEMSQSAVSHAIATLEDHLGVVLVSRGRHGARLTPVGKRIVEHARVIVNRTEEIIKEAESAKGLKGGQVRIASFRSVATHILPRAIAEFHRRFPSIAVHLIEHDNCGDVEHTLREGRADIGFILLPGGESLETWELLRDEYLALFPPNVKLFSLKLTWEDLVNYPLIMHPPEDTMMQPVYAHVQACGYKLRAAYEVETDAAIVSLVAQGLGATILPRLAAQPIPANVQVFSLPVPLERIIGVAILADALQTPAVYAFLDTIRHQSLVEYL